MSIDVSFHGECMEPTERQVQAFRRFLEILPHGKDIELIILKAHLLIEEQINAIIYSRLENPSAIKKARFDFEQRLYLAKALMPSSTDERFWVAARKLNELRNKIAHVTSYSGLSHKIEDFVKSVPADWPGSNEQETFELSLWFLFVHISGFIENKLDPFMEMCVPEVKIEN